jgi:hypothetical protein
MTEKSAVKLAALICGTVADADADVLVGGDPVVDELQPASTRPTETSAQGTTSELRDMLNSSTSSVVGRGTSSFLFHHAPPLVIMSLPCDAHSRFG